MGNLSTVQPRTIVAKVAERLGEIDAARERGVTWRSIAEAIGDAVGISPSSSAGRRLRIAVVAAHRAGEKGRLRPRPAGAPARPAAPKPSPSGTPGGFRSVLGAPGGGEELPPFGGGFEKL